MLAVDTNVIVRYLTRDDARQFARANALFAGEDVYVCTTVLLETEWVLRSLYRYGRPRVIAAFRALAGLPRITLEDPALTDQALAWAEHGMDLADALHLARTGHCEAFVSFDRDLARAANRIGSVSVRMP